MPTYALLLKAAANRVYAASALDLGAAELAVLDERALGGIVRAARRTELAGVAYLAVDTGEPLSDHHRQILSNLSSIHALFAVEGELLRPLPLTPVAVLDDDLTTIQRYAGKTNEAFTHLLVNVALAETERGLERLLAGERLTLLDPACGRGTTLNRAAVYGLDATGIELDQRDVEAYTTFLLTWLRDKRMKHELQQAKLRKGRAQPAHRITVTYGTTKDKQARRVVDVIHDDTRQARTHLGARSHDLLVCDLPYGVQHGARRDADRLDRGPGALLREALPVWFEVLRPGAGVALAWNRHTLPRPALAELVTEAGFELRAAVDGDAFLHRVDRSINRDVLLAARPGR